MSTIDFETEKTTENSYTTTMDYDANNNIVYIGNALSGSEKSEAKWSIKKITYDANTNITDIQWADGNTTHDNIWNNRTLYIYS